MPIPYTFTAPPPTAFWGGPYCPMEAPPPTALWRGKCPFLIPSQRPLHCLMERPPLPYGGGLPLIFQLNNAALTTALG